MRHLPWFHKFIISNYQVIFNKLKTLSICPVHAVFRKCFVKILLHLGNLSERQQHHNHTFSQTISHKMLIHWSIKGIKVLQITISLKSKLGMRNLSASPTATVHLSSFYPIFAGIPKKSRLKRQGQRHAKLNAMFVFHGTCLST